MTGALPVTSQLSLQSQKLRLSQSTPWGQVWGIFFEPLGILFLSMS